jgi:two-component system, NarL family, nitrate/nitrite response regulator NarL
MDVVNTLVVDSSRLFREGLRQLFGGTQFHIECESPTLAEAMPLIEGGFCPDLLLTEFDGASEQLEMLKQLRDACPVAKIIVLTNTLLPRSLAQALDVGVDGYLLKNISLEGLTQSLSLVMLGEKVFPTQLAGLLAEGKARPERPMFRPMMRPSGLSEREAAILRCLVYGYPNKVIADHLQMTEASVKVHLKAVLRKIHVSNRTQAAIWAINNGFQAESQH